MFRKRSIKLDMPKALAVDRLEAQLQESARRGYVKDDTFRIHKSMIPHFLRTNAYPINGSCVDSEEGVSLTYTIRPGVLSLIISFILAAALLHSLYTLICHQGLWFFPAMLLLWNLLFNGFILWEESICMETFEAVMQYGNAENS